MYFQSLLPRSRTALAILINLGAASLAGCSSATVHGVFDNLHVTAGQVNTAIASQPAPLPRAEQDYLLPDLYWFDEDWQPTEKLLKVSGTAGMMIVHRGEIVYEDYNYGKGPQSRFLTWSVSKSVTSALIGIALDEGYIESVTDPVVKYVPALQNTAFAASTLEDVLEMASGVRFDETYQIGTDIFRMQLAVGKDLVAEVLSYTESDYNTGTFNEYKSIDTVVLGMVLVAATGQRVVDFLQSRVWEPAGMTVDAQWLADQNGFEATFGGLRASMHDLAKFGLIYLNSGYHNGQQIVPQAWVQASLATSKPHQQPGPNPQSDDEWGYGYQWWIPGGRNDFAAVGVFNQFVYVNPDVDLVIVKGSGNLSYLTKDREDEHIALFREISDDIARRMP